MGRRVPHGKRRNVAEIERRIQFVEELVSQRRSRVEIERVIAEAKNPDGSLRFGPIPIRTIDGYIATVKKRWIKEGEKKRPQLIEQSRKRLEGLSKRAEEAGDFSAAIRSEALLLDLDGLRKEKLEISGPDGGAIQVQTGVMLLPAERD